MSSKKQTAVEWLVSILNKEGFAQVLTDEELDQAKAMEKEQIVEAYREGRTDQQTRVLKFYNRSSAIYYTSTYGQ